MCFQVHVYYLLYLEQEPLAFLPYQIYDVQPEEHQRLRYFETIEDLRLQIHSYFFRYRKMVLLFSAWVQASTYCL